MARKLFALLILSAAVLTPSTAEAQFLTPAVPEVLCTAGYPGFSIAPSACTGAWAGNPSNIFAAVVAQIEDDWGAGFSYVGKGEEGSFGPFDDMDLEPTGTLDFSSAITGSFILALKGSTTFSLYLFEDVADLTSLDFSMAGASLNSSGSPQGLSNASLWVSSTTVVPEPSTVILLGSGLFSLGLVGYRRRKKA